ncbi:uncharacterized protein LOC129751066 [Uranotaenia lowii]|uniref:uncharacterized protein LOC129751066 n=1 Tax=Uranotaenia lowii TaxID=190385 RepID=UPI00247B1331|nr:uncharacterized protein LOC129751066 [Uranotaenia lowii]
MNPVNLPRYVKDGIERAAEKLQFGRQHTVDFDFRNVHSSGSVSIIYQITIREDLREVALLCKVPPPEADEGLLAMFEREVFVYQQLLPTMAQFLQEQDIPETLEDFVFSPTCYHAYFDRKRREGILILENTTRRLFENRSKPESIDYDHGRLAMVQLGRFHAISLALKEQHLAIFEKLQEELGDVTDDRVESIPGFKETMEQAFDKAAETLNVHETSKKEKLSKLKQTFVEELKVIADIESSEPFCVVCHGDYSASNLMYSYNGGFPNRLMMLDWQLTRYGSPALDFLHFMFLSTDESFRRHHYDNMLQTYQNALRDNLERLGGENATERFPLTTLMRLIRSQAKYAIIMAMVQIPLVLQASPDTADELEQKQTTTESFDKRYQTRMQGLLRDVFRLGYL